MGSNPSSTSYSLGDDYNVNWNDVQTFITKLNELTVKADLKPNELKEMTDCLELDE
jgi:hypothetical protein